MGSALSSGVSRQPSMASNRDDTPARDVMRVYWLLRRRLPSELVVSILDHAEYWLEWTTTSKQPVVANTGPTGARVCRSALVSAAIPAVGPRQPVRRIEITTESRDQGFSSFPQYRGTREGSSSYFEASLVRPSKDLDGPAYEVVVPRCTLFYNLHAVPTLNEYTHILDRGHPLVDTAEAGDAIVLYCVAHWPLWVNECRRSEITVMLAAV